MWSREMWYTLNKIPRNAPGFRSSVRPVPVAMNELTQAEIDAGWELLFDGEIAGRMAQLQQRNNRRGVARG